MNAERRAAWRGESDRLAASLAEGFASLQAWLEAPGGLWRARPSPEGWSVAEICEHVALANRFLLVLIEKIASRCRARVARGEDFPAREPRFEHLEALASPSFRWPHPEHMAPAGSLPRGELARLLEQQASRCAALLAELPCGEGTLHTVRMSVVGERLDLYQYLRLVDLHLRRHLAQMERNREALSAGR